MEKLIIDEEFQNVIVPLTQEEYEQLKQNILNDGCRDPIVIWGDVIVDGHNRYKICTEHHVPFRTFSMEFKDRSDVIMWMIRNQLGRRNLTDFQRNEVALRYEQVIAEKMKENSLANLKKGDVFPSGPNGPLGKNTTKRKELARIAGTSEGSISRSKLILKKGTPEQIERARQGGTGNSISAIAKEIRQEERPEEGSKLGTEKVRDMDAFVEEFEVNFEMAVGLLQSIIGQYAEVLSAERNKMTLTKMLVDSARRIEQLNKD